MGILEPQLVHNRRQSDRLWRWKWGAVGIGVVSSVPAILIVPTAYHDVFIVASLVGMFGLFLYLDFQRFLIFRRDVIERRNLQIAEASTDRGLE